MTSPLEGSGSYSQTNPQKSSTRRKIPAYLQKMNSADKAANDKIIKNMQTKINYLKNPRFRINRPPISFQQDATSYPNNTQDSFRVSPEVVVFTDYDVNCVYEIPVTITNATGILKRVKHMPPASPEFSVSSVKYPTGETGVVAPGLSAIVYVNFLATSLSDFDDELLIVTEESSFKVKLQARREHPVLNLPDVLDCQGCWLGDRVDMAFQFTNKAGKANYKFFCEREEDDLKQTGEMLQLENFTLYPPEFSISKGEKLELYVSFTPKREGVIEERVILACDNNTSKVYTLRAIANTAELKVTKVNGNVVEKPEEFKTLFIKDVEPKFPKSSVLTVKNDTFVKVNYHWVINDEKALKDGDNETLKHTRYRIEPEKGVFDPNTEKDFKITFESDISMPFYKDISLVIDDVPFEAIKNPPEIIKQQNLEYINAGGDATKARPSLTYFQFSVVSDVMFNKVDLSPPTYFMPAPVLIKTEHQHNYSLKNFSNGPVDYKVKLHSKTSDFVNCRVLNNEGVIPAMGEVQLEAVIWSDRPAANQRCVFLVEVQNCDPLAFQIGATFQGPQIKIKQSSIAYGLVRNHTSPNFVLEIENISGVQAEVILRRKGEQVTFDDYKDEEPYYQWWDNLVYFDPQYLTLEPHETRQVNVILNAGHSQTIEEVVEILVLNGQSEYLFLTAEVQGVYVSLNRYSLNFPELFTGKNYEIGEGHEQRLILINYGNIPARFEWPELTGIFEATFEPQSGVIAGKTEIPITLRMVPQVGMDVNKLIECNIEGLDAPMGFELTAKVVGLSVTYELFEEEVMTHGTKKKKPGLVDSLTSLQAKSPKSPRSLAATSISMVSKQHLEATRARAPFDKIELMDMKINEPRTLKFVLKNSSGLNTSFSLYSENFEPKAHKVDSLADLQDFDTNPTMTSNRSRTHKGKLAALSPTKHGAGSKKKINDPLLSAAIEKVQNFTSAEGKALNKARRLEKDQKFYLANNKGVAIVCEPYQGELRAYEEVMVTVTIYNDACGKYEDFLWSEVKGLNPIRFPVKLNISGSPLVVTPNQVGVDYKGDYPALNLEPRMHSLGVYTKQVKLTNTSPQEMSLEWKIYNLDGGNEDQNDLFSIKLDEPKVGSKDIVGVKWLPIPPAEAQFGPFKIAPKTIKIKPRCTEVFTISFATPSVGKFEAVAVGETELLGDTGDEHKNNNRRNSLPFYLRAETVNPVLTLDKLKRDDGTQVVKFDKWALAQAKKQIKNVILRNHTPAQLDFTMQIDGPFRVRDIKTSSLEKYEISPLKKDLTYKPETRVTLRPEAFMEVLVEFEGFSEKDHEKWPLCPAMHIPGLIHVKHANGDYQSFDLEGVLRRPVLEINTAGFEGKPVEDIIDFDVCHINNFVQKTVYLVNLTKVPGKWKLNYIKYPTKKILGIATVTKMDLEDSKKTDDPDVFEFSMTEGVIGGRTVPVNKVPEGKAFEGYMTKTFHGMTMPPGHRATMRTNAMMSSTLTGQTELPAKIMINFKPKMNILYKSKFRITVEEGPSVDIILRGTGSYEEKLEK